VLIKRYNLEEYLNCDGHPSRTVLTIKSNKFLKSPIVTKTFIQQELLDYKILWSGYHCITYTFNKKDIALALRAYENVFKKLRNTIELKQNLKSKIKGKLLKQVFTRVSDFQAASLKITDK
jgi:hypothetical protein